MTIAEALANHLCTAEELALTARERHAELALVQRIRGERTVGARIRAKRRGTNLSERARRFSVDLGTVEAAAE